MKSLLLQITTTAATDTASAATDTAAAAAESVTLLDLAMAGGWAMYPLAILSIAGVYIFVERFMAIKKAGQNPDSFMERIKTLVLAGDINGARKLSQQTASPVSRMIDKGLSKLGHPLKNIEASIENQGKIEISRLEKNLAGLATVAGAAPMLGFLGTVTGMIQAFMAIAQAEGAVGPKELSGGIYEAMVTTAAGLIIGLPAYVGYNYLVGKIDTLVRDMEFNSVEFVELLEEPQA